MPTTATEKAREALAAWDALDPERTRVQQMKEDAGEGHGSYEEADSAGFDLHENEAAVGDALAEALRSLLNPPDLKEAERLGDEWDTRHGMSPSVWLDLHNDGDPTDPRPRFAAALVDPMLAATGHPAADDGPDWPEVRAYMGRNPHTRDNQPAASDEPQVQNTRRASRAFDVLHDYALHAGGLPSPGVCGDTPADALRDLLVDVRHAADALGLDFTDLDESADRRYREEAVRGEL